MNLDALSALASCHGVATGYHDQAGSWQVVSADTLRAVLHALGVDASTEQLVETALAEAHLEPWRRVLPPVFVTRADRSARCLVHIAEGDPVALVVEVEGGGRRDLTALHHLVEPRTVDGCVTGEAAFEISAGLPPGYHLLLALTRDRLIATCPLIVTPPRLEIPEERAIGWALQLYSVRSSQSWGVGDLQDLGDFASWSGTHGADFVLVNPMHAGWPTSPIDPSPYLPVSRRYSDPLAMRVEAIPEYASVDAAAAAEIATSAATFSERVRIEEQIDRDACWQQKSPALRAVFAAARSPQRQAAFDTYCNEQGAVLQSFAIWCALVSAHGSPTEWPAQLRNPDGEAVAAEAARLSDEVEYFSWCQWILADQLRDAHDRARASGMRIGVTHDLAVGVHPAGADAWSDASVYAQGVSVGAPPDMYNQQGQDWSQPPWRPDRLAGVAFEPYRSLLRGVLRSAGAIRIDHVLGLFRLWWIPEGCAPDQGTYVRYDHEALIGILVLEASRAGAVVIGEDLGTVEPWVRGVLAERGIAGTSILWFERSSDGQILTPQQWRRDALAAVTTHDLPPALGYLAGAHVDLRARFGLLAIGAAQAWSAHQAEIEEWRTAFAAAGFDDPRDDEAAWLRALYGYVFTSPARLVAVSLVDAVGDHIAQNQPGTHLEYPNWCMPLRDGAGRIVLLDDLPGILGPDGFAGLVPPSVRTIRE